MEEPTNPKVRVPSIINVAKFKRTMLDIARINGRNKTAVSKETIRDAENHLRMWMEDRVHRSPSKFKTL